MEYLLHINVEIKKRTAGMRFKPDFVLLRNESSFMENKIIEVSLNLKILHPLLLSSTLFCVCSVFAITISVAAQ